MPARPNEATSSSTAWRTWIPSRSVISSWLFRLSRSSAGRRRSGGTAKNRRRWSRERKARTTDRSADSGQEMASKTATIVTPPAGAHTRAHHRPSVASPSSTPWWRQSCASQSAGVAGQSEPFIRATGESSLIRPSSRRSPVPGSIRPNEAVITLSCSGTSRLRRARSSRCTAPCQLSRSSVTYSIQPSRFADGFSCHWRCSWRSRSLSLLSSGSRSGHSAVSTGTDRNGPLTSISLSQSMCACRRSWPVTPRCLRAGLIGPPPGGAPRRSPRRGSCAA